MLPHPTYTFEGKNLGKAMQRVATCAGRATMDAGTTRGQRGWPLPFVLPRSGSKLSRRKETVSMAQQCKDCDNVVILESRGNGKCSNCHGRGTTNTIVNDISGADTKCWKCRGTCVCSSCSGSGRIAAKSATSAAVPKIAPLPSTPILSSDLERSWYRLCSSSDFISAAAVDQYTGQLKATGNHAAIAVGLSDFSGETCAKCGAFGQFKIHFLGRLQHPDCGASFYIGPGAYMLFQLGQVFHTGIRAGGSMKDDADRKGDRSGGIINGIFGFLFVAVFRASLAVVLIPIQVVVSLTQSKPSERMDSQTKAATSRSDASSRQ
jgi:hypothetical protein